MHSINEIKTLGKFIREARKAQKLTQEQLSSMCGVGIRFIREVEQGKETCQIGKVLLVIKTLGLEIVMAVRGEI